MNTLGIITITYDSSSDVCKSLLSITSLSDLSTVYVIHKGLSYREEEDIKRRFSFLNINFIKQKAIGIYDAMNLGIKKNKCDFTYFLNAGDEYADKIDSMASIIKDQNRHRVLVFDSMQVYGQDKYLRRSEKNLLAREFNKIAHQAVIIPTEFVRERFFVLNRPISADTIWIEQLLLRHPHLYIKKPLTSFYLGGISNYPSLKSVLLRYADGGIQSSVKELTKLGLRLFLGNRRYYRMMHLRKRYF